MQRDMSPLQIHRFVHTESAGGIIMIVCAVLAMVAVNSPLSNWYAALVNAPISFGYQDSLATEPLKAWVKDILMVLFFLFIGLELKREMCEGFLSKRDQILLPLVASVSGMAVPAAIFFICNIHAPDTLHGWAIPTATDIAFALAILVLFGKNIPPSVKIFLLAIAIFDDLGAIIIIVGVYNAGLAAVPLLLALCGIAALVILNRAHVTSCTSYILVGIFLWFCFYHSGIHTTLAGVAVGFAIPMRNIYAPHHSPLNSWMHFLHPWISFLVLPVFAFTNAGVDLTGINLSSLLAPLPLGITLGLFIGKQIGIFGTSWLLIKTKLVNMPESASWMQMYAVSLLAGIGFTMSLFIGILAFSDAHKQELVKLGVIAGSLLSIVFGGLVLKLATRHD